jgi:hypothetical protein
MLILICHYTETWIESYDIDKKYADLTMPITETVETSAKYFVPGTIYYKKYQITFNEEDFDRQLTVIDGT